MTKDVTKIALSNGKILAPVAQSGVKIRDLLKAPYTVGEWLSFRGYKLKR
jgi:hypothetical protein